MTRVLARVFARIFARAMAAAACATLGACSKPAEAPADAGARAAAAAVSSRAGTPACPKTGQWTECQVFARLGQAGVAPRRGGTLAELPPVGATPALYTIGTTGLAVYLYPDSLARARAARTLDPLHFIAPSASLTMRGEATAIQNGNLLALLFSRIDQQRERVSDAFMAGAPQP